jgi:F0F1-type ATP synthase membrane subunit c/vacuolar-type H+-ATPase subunit K
MSLGIDESKGKALESEREVDASYRTLRIIWLAILVSVIALFVVSRMVEAALSVPGVVFWVLLALGIFNFGVSFLLKQKLIRQAAEQRKPLIIRSAYIVALALCESIGILGLVAHLITGVEQYYFFFVLSSFGILMHKPQRDDLLTAYSGGVWEARKND